MRQACDLRQSLPQKAVDQPAEARRGGVKGGADGIGGHLLQLAGDNGGEQGMRQICWFRLSGIPAPPMVLNHAFHACSEPGRRQKPPMERG